MVGGFAGGNGPGIQEVNEFAGVFENVVILLVIVVVGMIRGELAIDFGGFGRDDAAIAPETIGDFVNEMLLKDAFGAELVGQGSDEDIVVGLVFFKAGGIDDDINGV